MKAIRVFLQRLFITIQMYFQNGIANHAAACAYAFLLSMAPTLLLLTFLIILMFQSSPGTIIALINSIPFLGTLFDEKWLASDLFTLSMPFLPALVFIISIVWAGRMLALSLQRGLKIIFPAAKKRNAFKNGLITFGIETALVVFVFIIIISSRTALSFYKILDFLPNHSFVRYITTQTGGRILYIILLQIAAFLIYILVPVNPPKKVSAFMGTVLCGASYFVFSFVLSFILDAGRYNYLYGALGNLIIILVNVYFFFMFFFMGAQFAYVCDYFKDLPPSLFDVIIKKFRS